MRSLRQAVTYAPPLSAYQPAMVRHRLWPAVAVLCALRSCAAERAFKIGETVPVTCRNWVTGVWGPGPLCKETGKSLSFQFGLDSFLYCGVEVPDAPSFEAVKQLVELKAVWHCRVPVAPDSEHHVPFVLPAWGVAEGDHLHLNNRLIFALHGDTGRLVGATAYTVHDRFQFVQAGSVVSLHGPVRWFSKGTFTPLTGGGHKGGGEPREGGGLPAGQAPQGAQGGCSPAVAAAWSGAAALMTLAALTVLYEQRLKPQIVRRCLKAR